MGGTGRAGARAARRVRPDGAQLPEAARGRSRLRRDVRAHVPRRTAAARIPDARAGGRRAPRDPRSAVGAAWRDRRRPPRRACRSRAAASATRCSSRAAPIRTGTIAADRRCSAPSPAATSRRWACGCSAAAASTAATSSGASPSSSSTRRSPTRSSRTRIRSASASARSTPPRPGERTAWLTIVGVVANTPIARSPSRRLRRSCYMPMSIAGGPDSATTLVGPTSP